MRKVRMAKKSQNLLKSVESQSREIIASIYASVMSNESEKLQFSKITNIGKKSPQSMQLFEYNKLKSNPQPFVILLPFLEHIKAFNMHACTFILFNYNTIHVAIQQQKLKITKDKKQKQRIRYWLSHIYFSRFRLELAEQLFVDRKVGQRQVIHRSEQKQYMPTILIGKKISQSSIIRKITVSKELIYSKKGDKQAEPFCIGFFVNGSQQMFSFTQIASFIQYPFNIEQISYLQIITVSKQGLRPIITNFSKTTQTYQQMERIQKMKRVLQREQRWKYVQEEYQELKSKTIKDQNYKTYAQLLSLEIISYLQVRQLVQVKELTLQWIVDTHSNFIISNCFIYNFVSINSLLPGAQGLATLYAKKFMSRSSIDQIKSQNKFYMAKRTKSQEKEGYKNMGYKPSRKLIKRSQLFIQDLSSIRQKSRTTVLPNRLKRHF